VLRCLLLLAGCAAAPHVGGTMDRVEPGSPPETTMSNETPLVAVEAVRTTGDVGAYTVYVTLASVETGCDQYADWWEVISHEGDLLYRRVLNHSHPDDQPFERSGGPVNVAADQRVIVRGHMNPQGYVGVAMEGTFGDGLRAATFPADFAAELADVEPLPESCLF